MPARLNFCQWTDAESSWLTRQAYTKIERDLEWEDFQGRTCFGGLDLSFTRDLTALALAFPRDGDGGDRLIDLMIRFWKPDKGLKDQEETDRVPYTKWRDDGYLETTEGRVIKLGPVAVSPQPAHRADRSMLDEREPDANPHLACSERRLERGPRITLPPTAPRRERRGCALTSARRPER